MLIAQIINILLPLKNTKKFGIEPMTDNLVLCIAHIIQHLPKPHLVLVTGNITSLDS